MALDALIIQDISAGVHGRVEVHSYQDPFIIKYDIIHCEIILQLEFLPVCVVRVDGRNI
jgi:hypothetical protein